ncbi:hypothetical protein [Acidithiobacillus sulfuriphilus]|uniref:hypothetical protein n=1 Tax=Acidithiobacillus sulfuriphilus TaxID=1867749 RepID=UPI003F640C82
MNSAALIITARTQARRLGSMDPRAKRLSRLAARLESVLAARRRLQMKLERKGESA